MIIRVDGTDLINAQNVTLQEDGWIGISASSERIVFDGSADQVDVLGGARLRVVHTVPELHLINTTALAKSLKVDVDANVAQFREIAGSNGSLLTLDLSNGQVGIQTQTPDRRLEVVDSTNPQLRLTQTDGTIYCDFQMTSSGNLVMAVDGQSNQLVLGNGGNVGIGTALLNHKLVIDGSSMLLGENSYPAIYMRDTAWWLGLLSSVETPWADSDSFVFNTVNPDRPFVFQRGGIGRVAGVVDMIIRDGSVGVGTTEPDRRFHAEESTTLTNTVQQVARLSHITSGVPANSIGLGIEFEQETSANNNEVIATIEAIVTDVTAASEDADLIFKTMVAGAAAVEQLRVTDGKAVAKQLESSIATGTAPLIVASETVVTNLNADRLDSAHASVVPTPLRIPIADGANKLAAGWISEVIALTDLSDVGAKTGTGTTVVMDTGPTLVTPTIASFANATHNHQNAAGGGTLTPTVFGDIRVHKGADESLTNSTTLQDDNHLTASLAASSIYRFKIRGFYTTASATAGIKLALSGTVGVTSLKADIIILDNTTNAMSTLDRVTALGASVGSGITGNNGFEIEGAIETSTAGTFLLQWAQNTADAVDATTVQRNSFMIVEKI